MVDVYFKSLYQDLRDKHNLALDLQQLFNTLFISLLSISAVNVLDIFEYASNLTADRALRCL